MLTEDVSFTSSSAAAGFVAGGSMSGPSSWRAPDGRTLGEVEAASAAPEPMEDDA